MKQIETLEEAKNQLKIIKAGYILKMGEANSLQFFELRDNLQSVNLILNELNKCECGNNECTCNSFEEMIEAVESDVDSIRESISK